MIGADRGEIIRRKYTGGTVLQRKQLLHPVHRCLAIAVPGLQDITVRDTDPVLVQGSVEAGYSVPGHGVVIPVDVRNLLMSHAADIIDKVPHSFDVIRYHRDPAVKNIVNRHNGKRRADQLQNLRCRKINVRDHHTVQPAVSAMFIITHSAVRYHIHRSKCNIVAFLFCRHLKAVQDRGKIIMCQAAVKVIRKKNPEVIRSVCLQSAG